jgi:putative DNA primase/helicase
LPGVRDTSDGFWRRMKSIEYAVQIPNEEMIKDLDRRIIDEELPGILNWALAGCLDWLQGGLRVPEAIDESTTTYRTNADLLGRWLEERTVPKPGWVESSQLLWESFKSWCADAGYSPGHKIGFWKKLAKKLGAPMRFDRNSNGYVGVTLDKGGPL